MYNNVNAFNLFAAGFCFSGFVVAAFQSNVASMLLQLTLTLLNLGIVYAPKLAFNKD